MTTRGDRENLAELIVPRAGHTPSGGDPSYYERLYPPRDLPEGAAVTRLGPSPTGFIHLGNLYTAFMNEKLSAETNGVCILRIEDTDRKREVVGAVETLISSLAYFGVRFNEGVVYDAPDGISEIGHYGPYYQSARKDIYRTYVRQLVREGKAYPCFLTEEEINEIRARQERDKRTPGIYGAWAKYRDLPVDAYAERIEAGQSYVIRFKAGSECADGANEGRHIEIVDGIRGKLSMPANAMDVVILKRDGLPTYHFAHVTDDHLMRTTHVIRGEEWLSSLPIHVALFEALGFTPPIYCHSTVLMKSEGGKKRKLSKRKDPELSLEYYRSEGYHPRAVLEYLLTVINSNFEEWRAANPDAPISAFEMTTEKMGVSGILFDLEKLRDISKDVLVKIPANELADFVTHWAAGYRKDAHRILASDRARLARILDIGRDGDKPRKDLSHARQIFDFIGYFYDEFFEIREPYPDETPIGDVPVLLHAYLETYAQSDDRDAWFEKIRILATKHGYAAKPKDFKKEPDRYKGHVGHVSAVIRISIVGRSNSPDLYEIQRILGETVVRARIRRAADAV
ncbi:MAG: glutamate--tRNA ligase [Clostridiales Family XIII bacterium]|jgi:glutamyl-tRNA synthetase|nr:glutamate--tRNA ligase [Clostridiales Family XIII bacterium]